MPALLCALGGFLLPIFFLVTAVRQGMRPLAAASAYRNVAWRLGLDADTRGTSMHGYLDRHRLYVGRTTDVRGHGEGVHAVLDLTAPLGVGLHARSRTARRWARWRRGRSKQVITGESRLDDKLEIRAFVGELARALFTPDVRRAIRRLLEVAPEVELTDHWIRIRLARTPANDAQLLAVVDAMQGAAAALESARDGLGCPVELADTVVGWAEAAHVLGLAVDPTRPGLSGRLLDLDVRAVAVRRDAGWRVDVRVWHAPHPPTGLLVQPSAAPLDDRGQAQDLVTGDPPFDRAFAVQGYDPRRIREVLTPSARDELLGLLDRVPVRVDDVVLDVEEVPTDAEVLADVVARAARAAAALHWPTSGA